MVDPLLQDRTRYPGMTHWFNPVLIAKLLLNVIVSQTFGQYADRRLMVAALDTVPNAEHLRRATAHTLAKDEDGAIWIDYVADLGDGFDATYAIALLIAAKTLEVDGLKLPRAQLLVMGGDEVYPTAEADAYRYQLRDPYKFALRDPDPKSDDGIPVYAIPGNHDWYDGLVMFLAFFCRERSWHIGAWRTRQRCSYFAVKLTEKWWLWCIDIQLASDMDQPQADYFKAIAAGMEDGARIILCGAEPGWIYTHTNRRSLQIVSYAAEIAAEANRNLTIPIILSGDTHHYSRYAAEDGKQFITSGGGGAFLHPTHHLQDEVVVHWMDEREKKLSLKTDPQTGAPADKPACYPAREESRSLLWRNLLFPFTNWDFAILMGAVYWLFAIALSLRPLWDAYIITFAIFAGGLLGYTKFQEKSDSWEIYLTSIVHGLLHTVAVITLTACFIAFNAVHFPLPGQWYDVWIWLLLLLVEVGIAGGLVGAFLFGLNLLVTCAWFNMNHNDAFSAMRLDSHRHFLRMRIKDDGVVIYVVGLDKMPSREDWVGNPGKAGEPAFLPAKPLAPHLVERPIAVRA
jgi:calcineurin-like phosphoesterase family protein